MPSRDASPMDGPMAPRDADVAAAGAAPDPRERPTRPPGAQRRTVKVLFFSANALPDQQLALDREYRAIDEALQHSGHRNAFEIISRPAARAQDLQQALLEHEPDILHFSCHGTVDAELLLQAASGAPAAVPPASVSAVLRALGGDVSLVVFNACWSQELAEAVRHHTGLAIGMRQPIDDGEAICFASAFYNALGHGRPVRTAFDCGVAAIKRRQSSVDIPQLYEARPGQAASAVFVRPPPSTRLRRHLALAAAAAVPVLAGTLWAARSAPPSPPPPAPGPSPEMVRIAGAAITGQPGQDDLAQLPASCRSATAMAGCPALPSDGASARVEPFDLDRTEVTNRQFAAWLLSQPDSWEIAKNGEILSRQTPRVALALASRKCGAGLILNPDGGLRAGTDKGDWPVTCVTWHGANEYCRAQDKRLPLAAEWDLAARGPERRLFPWGSEPPRQDGVAFELEGATSHPRPVGASPQDVTPQGVRDLGGNVAEWVEDRRGDAAQKTLRGGTWGSVGPCHLLGARCLRISAQSYQADVGFRCARSVRQPDAGRSSP